MDDLGMYMYVISFIMGQTIIHFKPDKLKPMHLGIYIGVDFLYKINICFAHYELFTLRVIPLKAMEEMFLNEIKRWGLGG